MQMEKRLSMLLLLILLCVFSSGVNGKTRARKTLSAVNKRLKLLNKPAVKTIKSEDGDAIDCVDIYKQPAFDHPALKNHTIQLRPSFIPAVETSKGESENSRTAVSQTWRRSGSCPKGTIPIRRIRKQDLLRATSLDDYGRKRPRHFRRVNETAEHSRVIYFNGTDVSNAPTPENRSAAILFAYGYNFIGASADINVWNPFVEKPPEYTTAQIWLNTDEANDFESVEAGWQVNPGFYGDSKTRFFVFWTLDGHKSTGCFDLSCQGFVQTSSEIALGGPVDPISSHGQQYSINIQIVLDPQTSNWWLHFFSTSVGYWPASLFSGLKQSAKTVQWGGEVYSLNLKKSPHSRTGMGSGRFAEELLGGASFIRRPRVMDYSQTYKYPSLIGIWKDEYNCYSAVNYRDGSANANQVEPVFFFGGPGRNPQCP